MSLLNTIKTTLNKPFPSEESNIGILGNIIGISLFVTLFLYLFQPFGMSSIESNKFLICLGFGLTTFISYLIYELFIVYIIRIRKGELIYTFGKWIFQVTGLLLFISLANFLFIKWSVFKSIRWQHYPAMIKGTFAVGIFPTIFIGAITLFRQEKKYHKIAGEINSLESSAIPTPSERFFEGILLTNIRYIEALQNYIKIGHLNQEGLLIENTVRGSLKQILKEFPASPIVKCHRSFLVNRSKILSAEGNAQGLLLTLENCDKKIPVSRSFVPVFRK